MYWKRSKPMDSTATIGCREVFVKAGCKRSTKGRRLMLSRAIVGPFAGCEQNCSVVSPPASAGRANSDSRGGIVALQVDCNRVLPRSKCYPVQAYRAQ